MLTEKNTQLSSMLSPITTLDVLKSFLALMQSCTLDLDGVDGRMLKLAGPAIVKT